MERIPESELILNPDGTVYHLHLCNEHIADDIIVVGDPGRVATLSKHFDAIEFKVQNRELCTHTGRIGQHRITVLSTGMGTDNLDIVINELDAAVNIDLQKRVPQPRHRALNIIRLGTSGALQPHIQPGDMVASSVGMGLDGLLYFYRDSQSIMDPALAEAFERYTGWHAKLPSVYAVHCAPGLMQRLGTGLTQGITLTAPGFYAPQGRELRLKLAFPDLNPLIEKFSFQGQTITNFEMETSALYGLSRMLGHNALTICTIVANRVNKTFATNYHSDVERMVKQVLERLVG